MNKLVLTFLTFVLLGLGAERNGTLTDSRDGKIYKTLKIGEYNFMMDNLNYSVDGSSCFRESEAFCKTYGRAYNYKTAIGEEEAVEWDGVQGVCPEGWRIPSAEEWIYLIQNSGGRLQHKNRSKASVILAKNTFNLKLAGSKSHSSNKYFLIGKKGYYMTSSMEEGNWVVVDFSKNDKGFEMSVNSDAHKERAISCRCIQYSDQ